MVERRLGGGGGGGQPAYVPKQKRRVSQPVQDREPSCLRRIKGFFAPLAAPPTLVFGAHLSNQTPSASFAPANPHSRHMTQTRGLNESRAHIDNRTEVRKISGMFGSKD